MNDQNRMYHRNYGDLGSEFIIEHPKIETKKLSYALVFSLLFAITIQLHLKNIYHLWFISILLLLILIFRLYKKVHREVLLVLPRVGIQVKTEYLLGQQDTRFIDLIHVKDIVINEGITMQMVICYLTVLLKDDKTGKVKTMFPLFSHSRLGLGMLTTIYRVVQSKLFPTEHS